jgi:hypothetical protein
MKTLKKVDTVMEETRLYVREGETDNKKIGKIVRLKIIFNILIKTERGQTHTKETFQRIKVY